MRPCTVIGEAMSKLPEDVLASRVKPCSAGSDTVTLPEAADTRRPQCRRGVVLGRRAGQHRDEDDEERQALRQHEHREERDAPALEAAEEVGQAPRQRGQEGEDRGQHGR